MCDTVRQMSDRWAEGLPAQLREIAAAPEPVVRVLSGPGTGKTWAMVRRAARFVEATAADPKKILFVTFTRTSARDLAEQISGLTIPLSAAIDAGTLHSLCFRILGTEQALTATGRHPRPLLKFEVELLLHDLPNSQGKMADRREKLAAMEAAWAREQSDSPKGWPSNVADQSFQHDVNQWLRFHRGLLLAEFVPLTLSFLQQDPTSDFLARFTHILVDEYQDLNKAEQELIALLAKTHGNLTVVGDDDQAIYTVLRNASPEGIVRFSEIHHDARCIEVSRSQRCPPNIVAMANAFLANPEMQRQTKRVIVADPSKPDAQVHVTRWETLSQEIVGLAKYIRWYCQQSAAEPGDVLVLSPRRQIGYQIRDKLHELGVQAASYFNEEAFDTELPRKQFELLSLLGNREDRVALRSWLAMPTLRPAEYAKIRHRSVDDSTSPWATMDTVMQGSQTADSELASRFADLKNRLAALDGLQGKALVDSWLGSDSGEPDELTELRVMANRALEELPALTSIELHRSILDQVIHPELPSGSAAVRVMSLHKSKGLTAKLTIVTGFCSGLIPFVRRDVTDKEHERQLQEQRRLFFVAITRTTHCLILSSSRKFKKGDALTMGLDFKKSKGPGFWVESLPSPFASQIEGPSAKHGDAWLKELGVI